MSDNPAHPRIPAREGCPSCDRDLSYPGAPGHQCYTYAEWARGRSCNCATHGSAALCGVHTQADYDSARATWRRNFGGQS